MEKLHYLDKQEENLHDSYKERDNFGNGYRDEWSENTGIAKKGGRGFWSCQD